MSDRQISEEPKRTAWLLHMMSLTAMVLLGQTSAFADQVAPSARVKTSVRVRAAPDPKAKCIGQLKEGESAKFLSDTTNWRKIALASGRTGYVSKIWTVVTPDHASPDALVVTFIDVGEGDAILLQRGTLDILVDAGPSWTPNFEQSLRAIDGSLEHFWITHLHDDHVGAGAEVLAHYDVDSIRSNGESRELGSWKSFKKAAEAKHLSIGTLDAGEVVTPAPGLTIQVLASGGHFKDVNNDSLVVMVTFGGKRLLLTGDIEKEAEAKLIETYCKGEPSCPALRADVLKVPHHASAHFDPDFFRKVGATWAVISADFNDKHGGHCLPRRSSIDELHRNGTKVFSTSSERDDNVRLTITAAGDLRWSVPTEDVFAWDPAGGSCDTAKRVTYPQGN